MHLPRRSLFLLIGLLSLVFAPLHAEDAGRSQKTKESEARLKRDIFFLASDECEGRGPGTAGLKKAGDYIAAEFKKAGLKPGNPDGTWFQNFTTNAAILEAPATMVFNGPDKKVLTLKQGVDFNPMGFSASGKADNAGVVFAGYGITSKPKNKRDTTPAYDDYDGIDAAGKVVIVLRDIPRSADTKLYPGDSSFRRSGNISAKLKLAAQHQAAAVILVNDPVLASTGDDLLDFNFMAVRAMSSNPRAAGDGMPPIFHMKREVLETMLKTVDVDLPAWEKAVDKDLKPHSVELPKWTVNFDVKTKLGKMPLRNVVGVLEGKGPLANETVVIGAHYDHLGYGGAGNSLARGLKKMAIHHGADDNGSGSTSIMELARRFAAMPDRQGRRMVFMTFSGEELGLYGSEYYSKNPLYPIANTAFMLNLDMVGRLHPDKDPKRDRLLVSGSRSAKDLDKHVDEWNKKHDFNLVKSDDYFSASDHYNFYRKNIPVLFLWTGVHPDYHKPSDTADKINVAGMRRIVDFCVDILKDVTTAKERPVFQSIKAASGAPRPNSKGPRLGFRPDYDENVEGITVQEVVEGMPGAKAGLKKGDKIIEIGGKPTKTMVAYTSAMASHKAGDMIEIVVVRDGKNVTLKAKLE